MSRHAAVTIISRNYFAFAQTLAQSYLRHHPGHDFVIVLVDKADGLVPARLPCGAEVIEMGRLAIPDIGRFIYRYSIMELNTAVKPFALADLLRRREYETILYIDPDIHIYRPLVAVHRALKESDVVLTPHIRRPYYDSATPSDLTILQSGTYNLGFIGLRRSRGADRLLAWWMSKLYRDCVVDIPKGLFVDQKWIDLVPGMIPDHRIVHDPGYNAAYWNLHEREISRESGEWMADGEPLAFYHFSGYSPFAPLQLSKHQDRHQLAHLPELKALCDEYRECLMANGYEESTQWPYAFERLGNGVRIHLDLVRAVMQWAIRNRIPTPCPVTDPDGFCRFLVSRGAVPGEPDAVLIFHFLLAIRPDVQAAFPGARHDHDNKEFRTWISRDGGATEYPFLQGLLPFEKKGAAKDFVQEVFEALRSDKRQDVLEKYPDLWTSPAQWQAFTGWLDSHGWKQLRLSRGHAKAVREAAPAVTRILNLFFLRGDLQSHFSNLLDRGQVDAFVHWLRGQRHELELSGGEVSLFAEYARAQGEFIEQARFLYGHRGVPSKTAPTIFAVDARRYEIGSPVSTAGMLAFLARSDAIPPVDHYLGWDTRDQEEGEIESLSVPGLSPSRAHAFLKRVREGLDGRRDRGPTVNVAGYLSARSGMGESGRSMRLTLEQAGVDAAVVSLPHPKAFSAGLPEGPGLFGWPRGEADLSIVVANADATGSAECFLPRSFWGRRRVGYWVWETEALPRRFRKAGKNLHEIWTPSQYSANAIRATVDLPVKVLPHTLDFRLMDEARPNRSAFGLPNDSLLFGFIFDPMSVIERKNVAGLLKAFEAAFRPDDNCVLVLKINGSVQGNYDYEMIRAKYASTRVLWLDADLTREQTYAFIKSLDVYVSLHRAEGFGLTCAEAMGLGLPVVASGYSGNLEFMTDEDSVLVPTASIVTDRPYGPYPAGTRWGDPDSEVAAELMRKLLDGGMRSDLGSKAARRIRETLAPSRIGQMAAGLVQDTLTNGVN